MDGWIEQTSHDLRACEHQCEGVRARARVRVCVRHLELEALHVDAEARRQAPAVHKVRLPAAGSPPLSLFLSRALSLLLPPSLPLSVCLISVFRPSLFGS